MRLLPYRGKPYSRQISAWATSAKADLSGANLRDTKLCRANLTGADLTQALENYLAAKGVLVATGHWGNWELSAFAHALMTEATNVIVRPLARRE